MLSGLKLPPLKKWMQPKDRNAAPMPDCHPTYVAGKERLSQLHKRSSDALVLTARIPLKFLAQQRVVGLHRIGDSDEGRIMYIERVRQQFDEEDIPRQRFVWSDLITNT